MSEPSPGGTGLPGFHCLFDTMWAVPRWLGLGVDTVMSRMMHAITGASAGLAAAGLPGGPASTAAPAAGPPAPAGGVATGGSFESWPAMGAWAIRRQPAAGGGGGGAGAHEEPEGGPEGGLAASGIKLVEYALVSVRRCAEGILPGGSGEVLVTERMTGVDFAVWMVARYLQSAAYRAAAEGDPARALRHEDKKYLRVAYRVLTRWAEPPSSGCGNGRVAALRQIQRAVGDLAAPSAGAAPPRQVSAPTRSSAPSPGPGGSAAAPRRAALATPPPAPRPPARTAAPPSVRPTPTSAASPASADTGAVAAAGARRPAAPAPVALTKTHALHAPPVAAETPVPAALPGTPAPRAAATGLPSPVTDGEPAVASAAASAADAADVAAVLRALHRLGGAAATGDVVRRTNLPRSRVRRALHELEAAGRIRRSGVGLQTRYHAEVKQ